MNLLVFNQSDILLSILMEKGDMIRKMLPLFVRSSSHHQVKKKKIIKGQTDFIALHLDNIYKDKRKENCLFVLAHDSGTYHQLVNFYSS